jgi:hypothetical protein
MSVSHASPFGNDLKAVSSDATTSASPNPSSSTSHVTVPSSSQITLIAYIQPLPCTLYLHTGGNRFAFNPHWFTKSFNLLADVRALQRKSCLWFLGKAFQFLHHLHGVTHDYHCTRCAQGFVFAPLFRG